MIIRNTDRVLVQGITGKQGTFWAERMMEYGTQIMGGVNPRKAGTEHIGLPQYDTVREAKPMLGFSGASTHAHTPTTPQTHQDGAAPRKRQPWPSPRALQPQH